TGRFCASTCYNSEKALDLGGTMRNERDWVVVFDVHAIEAEVKAGNFITLGDSKVPEVDGRKKDGKDSKVTRYIPVPQNPHGLVSLPDRNYCIAARELAPPVSIIAADVLPDRCDRKLRVPLDVAVAEPELGLRPLHTAVDGSGNGETALFIDNQ